MSVLERLIPCVVTYTRGRGMDSVHYESLENDRPVMVLTESGDELAVSARRIRSAIGIDVEVVRGKSAESFRLNEGKERDLTAEQFFHATHPGRRI